MWDVLKTTFTSKVIKNAFNTYHALILPDLDRDGVNEILVAHGGNPTLPAKVNTIMESKWLNFALYLLHSQYLNVDMI